MSVMFLGPLSRWRRDRMRGVARRVAGPAVVAGLVFLALAALAWGRIGILPFLGLVIALAVAVGSVAPLWRRNLRRTPLFTWGMVIAHLGCAVSLAGMACDSAFTVEKLVAARPGDTVETAGWTLRFKQILPMAGDNWTALQADMEASRDGGEPVLIHPQSRFFASPPTTTTEAALLTRWRSEEHTSELQSLMRISYPVFCL